MQISEGACMSAFFFFSYPLVILIVLGPCRVGHDDDIVPVDLLAFLPGFLCM